MKLLGKKILIIIAHPDDESFLTPGLIYHNYQAGGDTYLLCATLGEKGKYHMKRPLSDLRLKQLRRAELIQVSKFLKVTKLKILSLPDGNLSERESELKIQSQILAKQTSPEVIISFGPDGITGHLDHLACHNVSRKLAKRLGLPFLAASLPPKIIRRAPEWLAVRRKNKTYASKIAYRKPNVKISVNPTIKLKALKMHGSQMEKNDPLYNFPKAAAQQILRAEYFVYRP